MKALLPTLLLAAVLAAAPGARAAVLARDDFTYPNGDLTGRNGGSGFSGAWGSANGNDSTGLVNASSNTAVYAGTGNGLRFRALGTPFASTGTLWLSFDYMRLDGSFGGLQLIAGTNERFLVGSYGFGSDWRMGRDAGNGVTSPVSNTLLKTGVVRFTLAAGANGSADLWVGSGVGPVDVTGAPVATLTGLTLTGINTLRIGSSGGQTIDNFLLGETAADVNTIPEPGAAVLGLLGLAGLLRRRRGAP